MRFIPWQPQSAQGSTYFGNVQSDGSPPVGYAVTYYGAKTFYGTEAASP